MKPRNEAAIALRSRLFKGRTVRPKRGKGSYQRNTKHKRGAA